MEQPAFATEQRDVHPDTLGSYIVKTDELATGYALKYEDSANAIKKLKMRQNSNELQPQDLVRLNIVADSVLSRLGINRPKDFGLDGLQSLLTLGNESENYHISANILRFDTTRRLDEIRQNWLSLTGEKRKLIAGAIFCQSLPNFLAWQYSEYHKTHSNEDVINWLFASETMPEDSPEQELAKLTLKTDENRRLMNVLQSHYDYIKNRQSRPEFLQYVEKEKQEWQKGVEAGVQAGWLDASAINRLNQGLKQVKVYEGDDFSTILQERAGYHYVGTDAIIISNGLRRSSETMAHELNHALLDGREVASAGKDADLSIENTFINEAVTEHIALAQKGDIDISKTNSLIGAYIPERQILRLLLLESRISKFKKPFRQHLKIEDFCRAYSASGDRRVEACANLDNKLFEMTGVKDSLGFIQKTISQLYDDADFEPELTGRERMSESVNAAWKLFDSESERQKKLLRKEHQLNVVRRLTGRPKAA